MRNWEFSKRFSVFEKFLSGSLNSLSKSHPFDLDLLFDCDTEIKLKKIEINKNIRYLE